MGKGSSQRPIRDKEIFEYNWDKIFKENPPKIIYVSSSRLICAINGEFHKQKGSAVSYAWFVWEKGYQGLTTIDWFN